MHVLVVEDETNVQKVMTTHLKRENLEVTVCSSGDEALKVFKRGEFDLVILDWMLPGLSGLDVCKQIAGQAPILMVTARAAATDIVLGLEMGADDYLTKPFEIPIFVARVRALLRRASKSAAPSKKAEEPEEYKLGSLTVNVPRVEVRCGKEEIKLTSTEFKLLVILLKNQGRVLSRERLRGLIQPGTVVVDRVIDTHVYVLRGKLGKCADFIETVRGIGYRIKG